MNDSRARARIASLRMAAAHEYELASGMHELGLFRAAEMHHRRGDQATYNVAELVRRLELIRRYNDDCKGTIFDAHA